jgi:hypothetical protein
MTTRTPEQAGGGEHPPNARRMYLGGLRSSLRGEPRLSVKTVDDRGLLYLEVTNPARGYAIEVSADFIDGEWTFIRRDHGSPVGRVPDYIGTMRVLRIILGLG